MASRVDSRAAFWLVAYAFGITMLGTTLPTPLYPAYEDRFGFGALTVTVVFATYAVGVLSALLLVGRTSDTVGRRPVLLAGLVTAALSSTIFLVAGGVESGGLALLLLGRLLSGLSAGIFTGTATATLADFSAPHQQRSSSLIAGLVSVGGLGLGPLVGGLLTRHVGLPLQATFALHLALLVGGLVAVLLISEPVSVTSTRWVHVQRLLVPAQARGALVTAGTAGFAGFAVLGMFTAVSPAVLALLGHRNPAFTGLVVFIVFAASAAAQVLSARLATRSALLSGCGCLVLGMIVIGASLAVTSLTLLVLGGVIAGAGQGLSFRAALATVTGASPAHERAAVASTFFVVCYVGISIPVVGVGLGTKLYGLVHTGEVFAGLVALLAAGALVSIARSAGTAPVVSVARRS